VKVNESFSGVTSEINDNLVKFFELQGPSIKVKPQDRFNKIQAPQKSQL
jgi:hypothetical protein